jgi:hypothetical protein
MMKPIEDDEIEMLAGTLAGHVKQAVVDALAFEGGGSQ